MINQFANLDPLRNEPGNVPLPILFRNVLFDTVFYDTFNLNTPEKLQLLSQAFLYEEGGMLVVHPAEAEKPIEYFSLSDDLLKAYPSLDTVVLPGVGSSAIGAAALARQIANITNRPAVAIITGYGCADMISEALGGWFDFGLANRVRCMIAGWKRWTGLTATPTLKELCDKYKIKSTTFLVDEPESNTLLNIMLRHADKLNLIVGHSKGALNVQNALFAFVDQTKFTPEAYTKLAVVTFGCGVELPESISNVHQFVGTWDLLGTYNTPISERDCPTLSWIDHKGHNLCSHNWLHMDVEGLLRAHLGRQLVSLPKDGPAPVNRPTMAA